MEEKTKYCGIDVSNETLDLYFLNQEGIHQHLQISNTVTGFRKMLKEAGTTTHFVMEATGVYHLNLIFFLQEKGCRFSVLVVRCFLPKFPPRFFFFGRVLVDNIIFIFG